jgi:hypothetical protein
MTIQSLPYSIISSLEPQTVRGYDADGVVDGRPVKVRQNRYGGVVPVVGSSILTSYGTARVEGYKEGSLIVAVTKFNDEFEFITADGSDILTAQEYVAGLARSANAGIDCQIETITRLYKSEVTERLPKSMQDKVDNLKRFAPNEFVMDLTPKSYVPDDVECLAEVILTEVETKQERERRRALEVKQALKLRRDLLDAYDAETDDCPEDIASEIADEFGDNE